MISDVKEGVIQPEDVVKFEKLQEQIQEKNQIIESLRKRLEFMEQSNSRMSFYESMESFSQTPRGSIVMFEEMSPLSPGKRTATENPMMTNPNQTRGRYRTETEPMTSLLGSPKSFASNHLEMSTKHSASMAILPTVKQVFPKLFSSRRKSNIEKAMLSPVSYTGSVISEGPSSPKKFSRSRNIFGSIFNKIKTSHSPSVSVVIGSPKIEIELDFEREEEEEIDEFEDLMEIPYSYIIKKAFPVDLPINLQKVERHLNWKDCIEYLGLTKDQLKYRNSQSIECLRRNVFLTFDQLNWWPADLDNT